MGCGAGTVLGSDYCLEHFGEALSCVVGGCAADAVTAHPSFCQEHLLRCLRERPQALLEPSWEEEAQKWVSGLFGGAKG